MQIIPAHCGHASDRICRARRGTDRMSAAVTYPAGPAGVRAAQIPACEERRRLDRLRHRKYARAVHTSGKSVSASRLIARLAWFLLSLVLLIAVATVLGLALGPFELTCLVAAAVLICWRVVTP